MSTTTLTRGAAALAALALLAAAPGASAGAPGLELERLSAGPAAGPSAGKPTAAERREQAKQLTINRHLAMARYLELSEGNLPLALKEYRAILRVDRKHLGAALAVARLERATGNGKRALLELKKLTRADPKAVDAWIDLGELHADEGREAEALEAWRKVLSLEPDHAETHRRVAALLQRRYASGDTAVKGELTRHLKAFLTHTQMQRGPQHAAAERLLAELEGGALAVVLYDAKAAYESAWSDNQLININRRMSVARAGFERCLELDPSREECHYYLGLIFGSVKASASYDLARAKAELAQAPGIPDAHVELAVIARKEMDDAAALASLQKALALDGNHQRALLELGIFQKLGGNDQQAIEAFAHAYRVDPSSSLASKALGELNLLAPNHALVQMSLRFGGNIEGDVFSSEKFKSAVTAFEERFGGVDLSAPEQAVLEEMLERLLAASDVDPRLSFRIAVLDTPIVNAFALPNGNMYFTKGFFKFMKDTLPDRPIDAEHAPIAHVLAHEITHVVRQHTVRTSVFRQAVLDTEQVPDPSVLVHLVRIHEIEADREGMVMAFLAGYHPRGGIEFMEARGKEQEIPPHLDHPTYDERIHYLEEYWSNDAKFAWLSFSFGLQKLDEAAKVEATDMAKAEELYRGAVEDFTRFGQTLKPTKEVMNNLGIAYAKLGIFRLAGPDNPLHTWNTKFSVERDLAMKYVAIRPAPEGTGTRGGPGTAPAIPRELLQAVQQFKGALQKDPDYAKARLNLTLCYLAMKKVGEARQELAALTPSAALPSGDLANLRGVLDAEDGQADAAMAAFASVGDDARAAATFNAARLHERAGRKKEARKSYEAFLGMAPEGAWADAARRSLKKL